MTKQLTVAIAASALLAACAQNPATTTSTTPAAQPQASVASDSGMSGMSGMRGGMRGEGRARMEEMLFNGITLTADQQAQVDSIRARHRADMRGLDPRNNPDDRQKMMQSMQAQMSEIRAVLTADQQAVFDQNVQQMRARRAQRDGGGAPPRE